MNQLVKALGIPYGVVERTLQGLSLSDLEAALQTGRYRYFYTISRMHYPLGTSYSDKDKHAIVALTQKYGVMMVEDDYMADFATRSQTALHYYDTNNQVVYLKSFSSIVYPSFKIGVMVVPPALKERIVGLKALLDYDSNALLQQTMALYLHNGMFAKHRQQLVHQFQARSKLIAQSVQAQLPTDKVHCMGPKLIVEHPLDWTPANRLVLPSLNLTPTRIQPQPEPLMIIDCIWASDQQITATIQAIAQTLRNLTSLP